MNKEVNVSRKEYSRWQILAWTSLSGKSQFMCKCCGRISATPDKDCYNGAEDYKCSEWPYHESHRLALYELEVENCPTVIEIGEGKIGVVSSEYNMQPAIYLDNIKQRERAPGEFYSSTEENENIAVIVFKNLHGIAVFESVLKHCKATMKTPLTGMGDV